MPKYTPSSFKKKLDEKSGFDSFEVNDIFYVTDITGEVNHGLFVKLPNRKAFQLDKGKDSVPFDWAAYDAYRYFKVGEIQLKDIREI